MNFNALFDGILFVEHTTPSRQTLNARQNVATARRFSRHPVQPLTLQQLGFA